VTVETNLGYGKYDLNLLIRDMGDSFEGIMVYNALYFDGSTLRRWTGHFTTLLENGLKEPDRPISRLPMLTPEEEHQLLVEFNDTRCDYPEDKTVTRLFEEVVARYPDRIAVVYDDIQLTYRRLDEQAGCIAAYLNEEYVVRPGNPVAVTLRPSEMMIAALLGILKTGGAYIPIDPDYPEERINYILSDSNASILPKDVGNRLACSTLAPCSPTYPSTAPGPSGLAYVIYTSGTTGRPKGCMITHRNLVRLMINERHPFTFGPGDVWVMAHSFCFDFSVWEMYGALLYGGRLIVPDRGAVRDTERFLSLIERHGVTILNQTPQAFSQLAESVKKQETPGLERHLRYVIFGGDRLEPALLKEWTARYPLDQVRLVNMYGITETTVHVTFYALTRADIEAEHPRRDHGDVHLVVGAEVHDRALPTTLVDLPERELEQVMLDFYHRRFNVLLCTTIVESGIDVPTANTIIINRADRFGLAQLHQLRGRVGRSHHRAYAYLMAPPKAAMTADAVKRLEAIDSLEDLGAGFTLATHDLEIRGAGELLGDTQSGQIQEIGFSLYTELLGRAVDSLRAGKEPDLEAPLHAGVEINLHIPALLPDDYIPDVHLRLILYKRLSAAETALELRELQVELIDRFGLLPDSARNLLRIAAIKKSAAALGIEKIDAADAGGYLVFGAESRIDPVALVQLVQNDGKRYRLQGSHRLTVRDDLSSVETRFKTIENLLQRLAVKDDAGSEG